MAMNSALRSCASNLLASASRFSTQPANRGFHSTAAKNMGGHGHDEPFYVHAKRMYNLERMKHQGLKMSLFVLGCVSVGAGVPIFAVIFQQNKAKSS